MKRSKTKPLPNGWINLNIQYKILYSLGYDDKYLGDLEIEFTKIKDKFPRLWRGGFYTLLLYGFLDSDYRINENRLNTIRKILTKKYGYYPLSLFRMNQYLDSISDYVYCSNDIKKSLREWYDSIERC